MIVDPTPLVGFGSGLTLVLHGKLEEIGAGRLRNNTKEENTISAKHIKLSNKMEKSYEENEKVYCTSARRKQLAFLCLAKDEPRMRQHCVSN